MKIKELTKHDLAGIMFAAWAILTLSLVGFQAVSTQIRQWKHQIVVEQRIQEQDKIQKEYYEAQMKYYEEQRAFYKKQLEN